MSFLAHGFPKRSLFFTVVATVLVLSVFATFLAPRDIIHSRFCSLSLPEKLRTDACRSLLTTKKQNPYSQTLGVASSVHVVSLARRDDRRRRMERIRDALDLRWEFSDALDKSSNVVDRILHAVHNSREGRSSGDFALPDHRSVKNLLKHGSFNVDLVFPDAPDFTPYNLEARPILCAVKDDTIPTYSNMSAVPLHLSLSRGMVACWYSHLHLIFKIAQKTSDIEVKRKSWDGKEGVAIIFEDDVDMEWNLKERLEKMWIDLPRNWDIMFLGEKPHLCLSTKTDDTNRTLLVQ